MALALGRTLAEVMLLSEAEINVWAEYRDRYGFPADRLAVGAAKAGAYVGGCFGGKATVAELMAKFQKPKARNDIKGVRAWFLARAKKGSD